jgi:hypothetical protein
VKIVAYLHSTPPIRYTGGELMTLELLEEMVRRGHEVTVFCASVEEPYERNGITITTGFMYDRTSVNGNDVFITHPEIRTRCQHHAQKLPYVGIVHNDNLSTMRSLQRVPPSLTIANSEYTKGLIPSTAQDHHMGVHVIHPPTFDLPSKAEQTREYVTLVNMSAAKGGEVFYDLAAAFPDQRFLGVIGGHGHQLVVHALPNVRLVQPTRNMDAVYAMTKVLLFPSQIESYGKVLAEAMLRGIPAIASDLPGIREAGGDAPLYCDPWEPKEWRDALDMLLLFPTLFDQASKASREQGDFLRQRTKDDLDRFEQLLNKVQAYRP